VRARKGQELPLHYPVQVTVLHLLE
jgi:hypothetical protein